MADGIAPGGHEAAALEQWCNTAGLQSLASFLSQVKTHWAAQRTRHGRTIPAVGPGCAPALLFLTSCVMSCAKGTNTTSFSGPNAYGYMWPILRAGGAKKGVPHASSKCLIRMRMCEDCVTKRAVVGVAGSHKRWCARCSKMHSESDPPPPTPPRKLCEDCGIKIAIYPTAADRGTTYRLPGEDPKRWCTTCARGHDAHPNPTRPTVLYCTVLYQL